MRISVLLTLSVGIGVLACSDETTSLKDTNQKCTENTECKSNICWDKVCFDKNPQANGGGCFGLGNCRSALCSAGACRSGTKKVDAPCRFNEECEKEYCFAGKCSAPVQNDSGPDKGGKDLGTDGDAGTPDKGKPDLPPPDLGQKDGGCTKDSDCNDNLLCTDDKCSGGKCSFTLQASYCKLDGKCFYLGALKPDNFCMKCDPSKSTTAWSYNDGQTCDDKADCTYNDACTSGTCAGTTYVCDDKLTCTTDKCTGKGPGPGGCTSEVTSGNCLVGLICFKDKQVNPNNGCHKCDATKRLYAWTPVEGKGCITTFAGTGTAGYLDGDAEKAAFNGPTALALDSLDNVYVADTGNHVIRVVTQQKKSTGLLEIKVATVAGMQGSSGFLDGAATKAQFSTPVGLAMTSSDKLIVADKGNNRIRAVFNQLVTTVAGSGNKGYSDGSDLTAKFDSPTGVAVDSKDVVYVADSGNLVIRKVDTATGIVSTLTDNATTPAAIKFTSPHDLIVDASGAIYVGETTLLKVMVVKSGVQSTLAGAGTSGYLDGAAASAQFKSVLGLALGQKGELYVGDYANNRVRLIEKDTSGAYQVKTFAGDGTAGLLDGVAKNAWLKGPTDMVVDSQGRVYITDTANNCVRLYTP